MRKEGNRESRVPIKPKKRQTTDYEGENNKRRRITWEKRCSKDTEVRRAELREKKNEHDRKQKRLIREKEKRKETEGMRYWCEKFREIAEKNRDKDDVTKNISRRVLTLPLFCLGDGHWWPRWVLSWSCKD